MNKIKNPMPIVIGASAGGMAALKELVAQFPKDFPEPIFIVNHMGAHTTGEALVKVLSESGNLTCVHAEDEQVFEPGYIYLAPSDQHMLIVKEKILITKGARENRSRPAILIRASLPESKFLICFRGQYMVPPLAIDVQIVFGKPLPFKPEFFQNTTAGRVPWLVVCHYSVQA